VILRLAVAVFVGAIVGVGVDVGEVLVGVGVGEE
jgi:uncharacterized membrane protein